MTTHFNYSLQNFSMNNAKVLTGNSQPVPDFKSTPSFFLTFKFLISAESLNAKNPYFFQLSIFRRIFVYK